MTRSYLGYTFEQLEGRLLSMIDDLVFRLDHEGVPQNTNAAAIDGTIEMRALAEEIKKAASCYRSRIVVNRFRLAPPVEAVGEVMIDPDRPTPAEIDYVRRIAGLARDGKVLRDAEIKRYTGIFMRHQKWKWQPHFPSPESLAPLRVGDDESIQAGRRPDWAPSKADEQFVLETLRTLIANGYVLAADADRYEDIMKRHPRFAESYPSRVRGAEAKRYMDRREPAIVVGPARKKLRKSR